MANLSKRLPQNAPGAFYVDATCIDCDTCRQIASASFRDHGDQSSVYHQPENDDETRRALMALVACPTASIGTTVRQDVRAGIEAFPSQIAENVYFCGYTAESSFGAWSYLIVRDEIDGGNVLVDSPRLASQLSKRIAERGGIRTMLLSHSDDIAAHESYARIFGCARVMHEADGAARRGIERIITGTDEIRMDDDWLIIPTPGHTRGHMVFLYRNKYLFTGDHLAWSPARHTLTAFRNVNWYSWPAQIRSMEKLLDYTFEWVLPGHGRIHHDTPAAMRAYLQDCIVWMRRK